MKKYYIFFVDGIVRVSHEKHEFMRDAFEECYSSVISPMYYAFTTRKTDINRFLDNVLKLPSTEVYKESESKKCKPRKVGYRNFAQLTQLAQRN